MLRHEEATGEEVGAVLTKQPARSTLLTVCSICLYTLDYIIVPSLIRCLALHVDAEPPQGIIPVKLVFIDISNILQCQLFITADASMKPDLIHDKAPERRCLELVSQQITAKLQREVIVVVYGPLILLFFVSCFAFFLLAKGIFHDFSCVAVFP